MKRGWWIAAAALLVLALVLALVVPGVLKKGSTEERKGSVEPRHESVVAESPMAREERTPEPTPVTEIVLSNGWRMQGSQVQWWHGGRLWKSVSLDFVTDDPSLCQLEDETSKVTCGSQSWHLQIEADCISLLPSHNKDE